LFSLSFHTFHHCCIRYLQISEITGYGRVDESGTRKDSVKVDEFPFEEISLQEDSHELLL